MSIDAKGIQLLLWRIIRFSGSCCYRFVRKYPVVSGFLTFVFVLYICFPSVFYFLMYSSPIIVCTVVSIRFYLKTKYPEFQWIKKKESDERSSADVNRSNDPSLRPQKSVRRNARKKVLEWDRKDIEERDMLFLDSLCKNNFLAENSTLILDGKGSSSMEHGESSSHNETGDDRALDDPNYLLFDSETSKPHSVSGDSFQGQSGKNPDHEGGGGEVEMESLEEGEVEEDEEVHKDGNKAVEWTENDQKNLMDLGFSELERNKRLESLIAKRRAKKLIKMAVDKSRMDIDNVPASQIAPIVVAKTNLLGVSSNPNEEGLKMPGSAPCIMLPKQNPFDLPYDPLEEKPNLMADSFHQEFMAANQKDMLFCRHESFNREPFFTLETTQDLNEVPFNPYYSTEERLVDSPTVPRLKHQSDKGGHHHHNSSGIGSYTDLVDLQNSNHNEAINSSEGKIEKIIESANDKVEIGEKMENPHDLEPELDSGSDIRMETDSIKNNDFCYSSSSEATESVLDQTSKPPGIRSDQARKALNLAIPPKAKTVNRLPYDSSPSPSERRRIEFNIFYSRHRRQCHTPTCSIASDLQVEVSEVGSPPLTTDGTVSSVDGDSVTYDGDVDRDINSDSEELWGGSFNLSRGEASREKLRELDDIIEEDSLEVEFSGLNRKPEEPVASIPPSEQEAKQNLNSTSLLSSRVDITENGASHQTYINPETHEDVKKIDEELEGFKTFNVSDTLSPENPGKTMHLMEKSVVHTPSQSCFEKPKKPTEELNIICNEKPITQGDSNTLDSKSSEHRDNGAQILIETAALGEMRKPAEAINLGSSEPKDGNLEASYEPRSTMESEKEMEESQTSKYIEEDTENLIVHKTEDAPNAVQSRDQPSRYIEEDTENLTEHNTGDASNAVQSRDNLRSILDTTADQNVAEDNVSVAMALNRRLVIEQLSVGSCSSPRSVLPQNILEDQIPISDVEQQRQTDVPQSVMEDVATDNFVEDQPHENLISNMHQIENSVDRSSSNCSLGTLEGSSKMTESTAHTMLLQNILEDQIPVSDVEQRIQTDVPQSVMEDMARDNLEDDQPHENLTFNMPQIAQQLVENSTGHSSSNCSLGTLKGSSNMTEKSTNDSTVHNMNELVLEEDKHGKEDSSIKSGEGESKTLMSLRDAEVLSQPSRENNPGSIKHLEGGSEKLIDYDTGIVPLKSDDPETMVREEEPTKFSSKVIEECNIVVNINNSVVNEKEEREKLTTNEGESSIKPEDIRGPEKSNEHEADVNKTEANESKNTSIPETAREEEKPAGEVDSIPNVNDSSADNLTNNEILNHVVDGEREPQILSGEEAVMEPSKTSGATSAESVEDTEHESKRLTEAEANAGLSTSAGESNSLNNIKNGEEIQNLTGQEGVLEAPQSGEDDLKASESIPGAPTEFEIKVVNTEENDAVAK